MHALGPPEYGHRQNRTNQDTILSFCVIEASVAQTLLCRARSLGRCVNWLLPVQLLVQCRVGSIGTAGAVYHNKRHGRVLG